MILQNYCYIKSQSNQKNVLQFRREPQVPRTGPYDKWTLAIRDVFQQHIRVVAWLHSIGIAHRDLSLENTLLIVNPNYPDHRIVRICDFGMATYCIDTNGNFDWHRTDRVGKANYMAPEVCGIQTVCICGYTVSLV